MVYDFHTHTFLSDGVLLPIELIRRAIAKGYRAIGITDHASLSTLESILPKIIADCQLAEKYWEIRAIPGVEITHVPPEAIAEIAEAARELGAELVVVHGETPVEPVPAGTNLAALQCPEVDILAHPGRLDQEMAALAAKNGIFLEVTARAGHSLGNGSVVARGRQAGAAFLINSDTHTPSDLLTDEWQRKVALGAGLTENETDLALTGNPQKLLEKIADRRK
jgi:histidinol phosphatase-like PHP family hydrolase